MCRTPNYTLLGVLLLGLIAFSDRPGTAEAAEDAETQLPDGAIAARVKGTLAITWRETGELLGATVRAGGSEVFLDWTHSEAIRDELFWWRFPRTSSLMNPQADVRGRLRFVPPDQVPGRPLMLDTRDRLVPLLEVESIQVRLAGADGQPHGPQPNRPKVFAHGDSADGPLAPSLDALDERSGNDLRGNSVEGQ